jgi:hypothetical protein
LPARADSKTRNLFLSALPETPRKIHRYIAVVVSMQATLHWQSHQRAASPVNYPPPQ